MLDWSAWITTHEPSAGCCCNDSTILRLTEDSSLDDPVSVLQSQQHGNILHLLTHSRRAWGYKYKYIQNDTEGSGYLQTATGHCTGGRPGETSAATADCSEPQPTAAALVAPLTDGPQRPPAADQTLPPPVFLSPPVFLCCHCQETLAKHGNTWLQLPSRPL